MWEAKIAKRTKSIKRTNGERVRKTETKTDHKNNHNNKNNVTYNANKQGN